MNSWGRIFEHREQRIIPAQADNLPNVDGESLLARGNARSYGDVALNTSGYLLDTSSMHGVLETNWVDGEVTVGAGSRLGELLRLVEARAWTLPVVPGTQQVTVGGCIANDVHGKNHHLLGSFGHHVLSLTLLRSDGGRLICSATQAPDLYRATIGGLGLTGLIVSATLKLAPLAGGQFRVRTVHFDHLGDFFKLSAQSARDEYSVAWIDAASIRGRGVFQSANTVTAGELRRARPTTAAISVPDGIPFSMVTSLTAPMFAAAYRGLQRGGDALVQRAKFLFPLDAVANWNRLYGRSGFVQFQCALPATQAESNVMQLLAVVRKRRAPTFLNVLKQFGEHQARGLMSFPRPGITLAIDFPYRGEMTRGLLQELEQVVVNAGGAIYPAKDAFMSGATLRMQSPEYAAFLQARDPRFDSDFARRVCEPGDSGSN